MIKNITGLLVSVWLIASCSVVGDPDEIILVNIGTDYFLEVSQSLVSGPNALRIDITSFDTDNCENSYIDFSYSSSPNLIRINLDDIVDPINCVSLNEPVSDFLDFELLKGRYDMTILFKDILQNDGEVEVTDDQFKLKLETENGVVVLRQQITMLPDGYVWGRMKINDVEDLSQVKLLITELKQNNFESELSNGNYGHFEIDGHLVSILSGEPHKGITESFIMKQNQSFGEMQLLLSQFSESHPKVDIEFFSSEGETYQN